MTAPFFSLNSWVAPGWMYQGENPVEIIEGGPGDWDRLERALQRHRAERLDASPHPRGGAVGYFEYDGSFWFGIFPEIHAEPMGLPTPRWSRRSREHEARRAHRRMARHHARARNTRSRSAPCRKALPTATSTR